MSDEREERLKQIRQARQAGVLPWSHLSSPTQINGLACSTIDFLLSLIDSEAAGPEANYLHHPQFPMNGTELECDGEELRPDGMCAKCERVNERIEAKLTTIRQEERRAAFKESVAIIVGQPTAHYIYSGATPMAAETFRDNAIGAIEAVIAIEQARRSKLEAAANETREDGDDG